jgi:hypothetical protein
LRSKKNSIFRGTYNNLSKECQDLELVIPKAMSFLKFLGNRVIISNMHKSMMKLIINRLGIQVCY